MFLEKEATHKLKLFKAKRDNLAAEAATDSASVEVNLGKGTE